MLALPGSSGQVPADPVVDRAEGKGATGLDAAVLQHPGPFGAGEVGVENEPGDLAHEREMAGFGELRAACRGPPVLPDDRPMTGPARRTVPGDRCLALVGDADRGRGVPACLELVMELAERCLDQSPDLGGVVLNQAGGGEVLWQLPVRGVHDATMLVDGQCPHSGSAGVYRDHDCHVRHGSRASGRFAWSRRLQKQANENLRERPLSREDERFLPLTSR